MSKLIDEIKLLLTGVKWQFKKLRANKHKPGWKDEPLSVLLCRLDEEMCELKYSLHEAQQKQDKFHGVVKVRLFEDVAKEAADVANFAHMLIEHFDHDIKITQKAIKRGVK